MDFDAAVDLDAARRVADWLVDALAEVSGSARGRYRSGVWWSGTDNRVSAGTLGALRVDAAGAAVAQIV
jgi:hypothetical protein